MNEFRSYRGMEYIKDPNCRNKNYRDNVLDEIMFEEIRKLKSDPLYIPTVQCSVHNTDKKNMIKERMSQIESQVSRFMDLYSIGGMDLEVVTGKVNPLNAEKKSLKAELEELESQETSPAPIGDIISLVDEFEEVVAEGDCQKIHGVVTTLIEKVVIDGPDIRIHWNF